MTKEQAQKRAAELTAQDGVARIVRYSGAHGYGTRRQSTKRAADTAYYAAHREEIKARSRAWREAHPDARAQHYAANPEAALTYARTYYWAHREECLYRQARYRTTAACELSNLKSRRSR